MIRSATQQDAPAIAAIYNHFIAETVVTFEEQPVSAADIAVRMAETLAAPLPYLVVEHDAQVVGFAYASRWHGRCAYRFSLETTVYLDPGRTGEGLGSRLYGALLERLRAEGFHAAMGGIALPNPASVALHEKLGFSKVAHFPEVGYKFDRWIDVGYWQCML